MTKDVCLLERMSSTEGIGEAEIIGLILQKANLALPISQNQNCKKRVLKSLVNWGVFSQVSSQQMLIKQAWTVVWFWLTWCLRFECEMCVCP